MTATKKPRRRLRCTILPRRMIRGVSLGDVSRETGLMPCSIWELERGNHEPMLSTARAMADYFRCSIDDLWPVETQSEDRT